MLVIKLHLTFCSISGLSTLNINELDVLLESSPYLSVDLSDNPLQCTCDCLHSIRWIAHHQHIFRNLHNYSCNFKNQSKTFSVGLEFVLGNLEEECQSLWWLYGSILSTLVAMVLTIIVSLALRWRLAIELHWYKPRSVEDEVEYEYDSFVVYNKADKNWVQNQLCGNLEIQNNPIGAEDLPASRGTTSYKLCCHHRDFMIGMHIIDNITEAFENSRTTLIVMTNAALCGNWWQLELQMAVQTAVARRTCSLLFVFLEPLQGRLVTPQLRRILNTYTCKRWYPNDFRKQRELWRDLKIAMKFPKRNWLTMERRPWKCDQIKGNWIITMTSHGCVLTVCQDKPQRKHQRFAILAFCEGNSLVTGGFLSQRASNMWSVSISWRHLAGATVPLLRYAPLTWQRYGGSGTG